MEFRKNFIIVDISILIFILAALPPFGLLSCRAAQKAPQPTETVSPPGELQPQGKPVSGEWKLQWDNILKEAKKESRVVIYTGVGRELLDPLTKAFNSRYKDIEVEFIAGRTPELVQRHLTQQKLGLFTTDLYAGSGTTSLLIRLKPADALVPLEPYLILPEVIDPGSWYGEKLPFVDKDKTVLYFVSGVTPPITINTQFVKQNEIESYKNLLEPRWKGKIVMDDPTLTGPASAWFSVAVEKLVDVDYMKQLARQEPVLVRDYRLPVEWLAHGKYLIGLGVQSTMVRLFQKMSVPLLQIIPVEGAHTAHGVASVAMIKGAPHKNAATVFVNWLLSREGQLTWSKAEDRQSVRVDVPADHLEKIYIRQPGIKYYASDDEEFLLRRPKYVEQAREIFGHLLGR